MVYGRIRPWAGIAINEKRLQAPEKTVAIEERRNGNNKVFDNR